MRSVTDVRLLRLLDDEIGIGSEEEVGAHRAIGRFLDRGDVGRVVGIERVEGRLVEEVGRAEDEAEATAGLSETRELRDRRVDVVRADPAEYVAVLVENEVPAGDLETGRVRRRRAGPDPAL